MNLVEDLYLYVLQMLSGEHESCQRIHLFSKPSKQFIIGSLADASKNYAVAEAIGESKIQAKSALRHNSMGVFCLLNKRNLGKISVTPTCSVFYKVFPTYEEQFTYYESVKDDESVKRDPGFKEVFTRKDLTFDALDFTLEKEKEEKSLDFSSVRTEIISDDDVYRMSSSIKNELEEKKPPIRNEFDPKWISSEEKYRESLSELKKTPSKKMFDWKAEIIVEKEYFSRDIVLITIWFRNITEGQGFEKFLFNCRAEVDLKENAHVPFEYNYSYEGFDYIHTGDLRTINCHADLNREENIIITKPYGLYNQQRRAPRNSIKGVIPRFENLKSSLKTLRDILKEMQNQLGAYEDHLIYEDNSHPHHAQFMVETDNFRKIIERYANGIAVLESNANAKRSFMLMNEVFEEMAKGAYEGWRLFQIVFIVMLIPDIVDLKKNRDIADIIHVDTGGGKSEAYFGLVVFLLFWDRLRGKNKGVSAFTKFPLRMLSIQQLQRIAKSIVIAEEIRKREKILGDPFSVGYYVGVSDEFPRHTRLIVEKIQRASDMGETLPGMILDECPLCNHKLILTVHNSSSGNPYRVVHTCEKCEKHYYLYFSNSEIYRLLPSFIVSTVDKLASVALNRRFKNLMGGKLSKCSEGHMFNPKNDKCDYEIRVNKSCQGTPEPFDELIEGPTLMIQDEMHLIREGFGTIDSHFESMLNTLLRKLSNKEFKYISMTATVSGAREQIDHLYGKDYFIFPSKLPRGFDEKSDFFFEREEDSEGNPKIQRVLIGLKPNLRDNQFASLWTIYHISKYLESIKADKARFSAKYALKEKELENELKKYQCLLTYHGKKADVFGMNYFIHTVVTSKLKECDVEKIPLTGDNLLEEIKNAILKIQKFPDKRENENKIHATFATSVVSHGVDIDNWNLMIFQGMTRDTSEYIQALSRVGRRYQGVIFLWFYPNRVRDLSYYKNFNLYHEILQHRVEKTPISRWTKLGFMQTFTSIFCGAILNYISNEIERPLYTVDAVNAHFDDIKNREHLFKFIEEAYYSSMSRVGADWFKENIRGETERRLNQLKIYSGSVHKNFFPNALKDSKDPYFKTQYGMRGIQEEIVLRLNEDFIGFVNKYQRGGE